MEALPIIIVSMVVTSTTVVERIVVVPMDTGTVKVGVRGTIDTPVN